MNKENMVVDGSDIEFGLFADLFLQLNTGSKTKGKKGLSWNSFLAFLSHQDPFQSHVLGEENGFDSLRNLLTQLEENKLTWNQLRAIAEHRNPFDKASIAKILPYADEEVKSTIGYPEGFHVRTPQEQVAYWLSKFSELDASHVEKLSRGELPEGTDGWAVIPKESAIAENNYEAFQVLLDLIAKDQKFHNYREGALTERHLRLTEKTKEAHRKLNEQPGDFRVFPFQFGIEHRGESVRRSRVLFTKEEFGLCGYDVAALLLTHPDRIQKGYLNIDCAGVEYSPDADGSFWACLYFSWGSNDELLALGYYRTVSTYNEWGAVSGFVSQ